jgi:hypothetical protein
LWSALVVHLNEIHLISNISLFLFLLLLSNFLLGSRDVKVGLSLSIICYTIAVAAFVIKSVTVGGWALGFSGGLTGMLGFMTCLAWRNKSKLIITVLSSITLSFLMYSEKSDNFSHITGWTIGLFWGSKTRCLPLSSNMTISCLILLVPGIIVSHSALCCPKGLWSSWTNTNTSDGFMLSNGLCNIINRQAEGLYHTAKIKHLEQEQRYNVDVGKRSGLNFSTFHLRSSQITFGLFYSKSDRQEIDCYLICLGDVHDILSRYGLQTELLRSGSCKYEDH